MVSVFFVSGMQVVMASWRRAKKQGTTPGVWRDNGWTHNFRNFVKAVVCEETGDCRWFTKLGRIIDLDPDNEDFDRQDERAGDASHYHSVQHDYLPFFSEGAFTE